MFVIWKRPDGFHGASPADYQVVEFDDARIWLHKSEKEQFPFRVSGGWEEGGATERLNTLVNAYQSDNFLQHLIKQYEHTIKSEPDTFINELENWFEQLIENPKGDTWEIEIIVKALRVVQDKIKSVKSEFLQQTQVKD